MKKNIITDEEFISLIKLFKLELNIDVTKKHLYPDYRYGIREMALWMITPKTLAISTAKKLIKNIFKD